MVIHYLSWDNITFWILVMKSNCPGTVKPQAVLPFKNIKPHPTGNKEFKNTVNDILFMSDTRTSPVSPTPGEMWQGTDGEKGRGLIKCFSWRNDQWSTFLACSSFWWRKLLGHHTLINDNTLIIRWSEFSGNINCGKNTAQFTGEKTTPQQIQGNSFYPLLDSKYSLILNTTP